MEFELDEKKLKEIAELYGFEVKKVDKQEDAGVFIDGKQVSSEELFGFLFPDNKE